MKITKSRFKEIVREELSELRNISEEATLTGKEVADKIKNSKDKGHKMFFGKKSLAAIAKKSKWTAKELDQELPDFIPGNLIHGLFNENVNEYVDADLLTERKQKPCSPKRKGPCDSATEFKKGDVKKGQDGNYWQIIIASNGIPRWQKLKDQKKVDKKKVIKEMRPHVSKDLPGGAIWQSMEDSDFEWEDYLGKGGMKELEKQLKKMKKVTPTQFDQMVPGFVPGNEVYGVFKNHLAVGPTEKMKITKDKLKDIIREELAKHKSKRVLTEGWWGWDLNEFEPWRDDTLAFIKSSEGKLKQIASIAIKGMDGLLAMGGKELDTQAHDVLRRNVHTAVVKFNKEWKAVNAKYKSGGDSWWDATDSFTSPLRSDDKLKPVGQVKYSGDYSEFLELIDALHPDFQKSRWDESQQYSGTYMKNIRKEVKNASYRKARDICAVGIMQLIKLPKSVYKNVADDLQEFVFDNDVAEDAWNTETDAFVIAWIENDKEAESKSNQAKEHSYKYKEMIDNFKYEMMRQLGHGSTAGEYFTGSANPNGSEDGEWVSADDENWDYEGFITWQWKRQNADAVDDNVGTGDDYVQPSDSDYEIVAGSSNERIKRSEVYKDFPWDRNDARNADIPNAPKGFLPSQRIFAKGVKQGPQ
jgi:hypothetical protein